MLSNCSLVSTSRECLGSIFWLEFSNVFFTSSLAAFNAAGHLKTTNDIFKFTVMDISFTTYSYRLLKIIFVPTHAAALKLLVKDTSKKRDILDEVTLISATSITTAVFPAHVIMLRSNYCAGFFAFW